MSRGKHLWIEWPDRRPDYLSIEGTDAPHNGFEFSWDIKLNFPNGSGNELDKQPSNTLCVLGERTTYFCGPAFHKGFAASSIWLIQPLLG